MTTNCYEKRADGRWHEISVDEYEAGLLRTSEVEVHFTEGPQALDSRAVTEEVARKAALGLVAATARTDQLGRVTCLRFERVQ